MEIAEANAKIADFLRRNDAAGYTQHRPRFENLEKQAGRQALHAQFPHVVVAEDDHYSLTEMERWCRAAFGHPHGECHYDDSGTCPDGEIDPEAPAYYAEHHPGQSIDPWDLWTYDHCHVGTWAILYLLKTGYDYGFQDFCFHNPADADSFRRHFKL